MKHTIIIYETYNLQRTTRAKEVIHPIEMNEIEPKNMVIIIIIIMITIAEKQQRITKC